MKAVQVVANTHTEVATKTQALLLSLTIVTLHEVIIKNFGADKWLIVVVYE